MSRARDIMSDQPVALRSSATVADAVELLHSLDIRHAPVINTQHEVVGMVSDRDLSAQVRAAKATPITEVMSSEVIAVAAEAETTEIIALMLEHKVGALPVLDGERRLLGIVSYLDLLRELHAHESSEQ